MCIMLFLKITCFFIYLLLAYNMILLLLNVPLLSRDETHHGVTVHLCFFAVHVNMFYWCYTQQKSHLMKWNRIIFPFKHIRLFLSRNLMRSLKLEFIFHFFSTWMLRFYLSRLLDFWTSDKLEDLSPRLDFRSQWFIAFGYFAAFIHPKQEQGGTPVSLFGLFYN